MAQKALYDLTLNISANSAELKKELDNANKKLDGMKKNSENTIGAIKTSTVAIIGSITGVALAAKKVFESTQFTGDTLAIKIAGIKEVANTVAQNLASLDFSVSLRDAKKAAEEYASALDDLSDRRRSVEIISAKNYTEVTKLKGQLRDVTLSEAKRLEVSSRIQAIALEEFQLREQMATEALDAINQRTSTKYKMDLESAKLLQSYVEDYARFNKSQQDALTEAMKSYQALDRLQRQDAQAQKDNMNYQMVAAEFRRDIAKAQEDLNEKTEKVPEAMRKWIELARPISDLTDDQRTEIRNIVVEWYNANTQIQTYLNTAEKVENKINKIGKGVENITRETPIDNIDTSNIAIPRVAPAIDSMTLAKPPAEVLQDWQAFTDSLNEIIAQGLQNVVQTMSEGFGALIIEGKGALPKLATSLLGAFANILDQLSAIAFGVAFGIKAIKTALKSLNPAVALAAGIALAALSGLVKAGIAKIADKSSSVSSGSNQPSFGNFADGGVVYGETIARVAEYSGARTNPEVIAPLDKLKNLLGNAGGLVEFQIKDDILYGILDRRNRRVSSYA